MENVTTLNATNSIAAVRYQIDSLDLANSGWDTEDPESKLIISWYSRSSIDLTGLLSIILPASEYNSVTRRAFSHNFTQSANTWTHHYLVLPGDSSLIPGTLFNDQESTAGMTLFFAAHYGTNFTDSGATMDQWHDRNPNRLGTDFPQDWRNTAGATFDITGVQVEVAQQGQTRPTPFEHIPFDMSLKRCQRYFQHFVCGGSGTATGGGQTQSAQCTVNYTCEMRTTPTITFGKVGGSLNTNDSVSTFSARKYGFVAGAQSTASGRQFWSVGLSTASAEF